MLIIETWKGWNNLLHYVRNFCLSMNKRNSSSAFTYHVLSKVDPQIMESLTQNQLKAIHDAIAAQAILSRHPFDVRGTIPLFFIRYYFVVLMGRDMRPKTRVREHYRRREGDVWANFALVCFILIPLGLLVFLLFYYIKTELGIDYIENFHLTDILN